MTPGQSGSPWGFSWMANRTVPANFACMSRHMPSPAGEVKEIAMYIQSNSVITRLWISYDIESRDFPRQP